MARIDPGGRAPFCVAERPRRFGIVRLLQLRDPQGVVRIRGIGIEFDGLAQLLHRVRVLIEDQGASFAEEFAGTQSDRRLQAVGLSEHRGAAHEFGLVLRVFLAVEVAQEDLLSLVLEVYWGGLGLGCGRGRGASSPGG